VSCVCVANKPFVAGTEEEIEAAEAWGNKKVNAVYEATLQDTNNPASDTTSIKPLAGAHSATRDRYVLSKYLELAYYSPDVHYRYIQRLLLAQFNSTSKGPMSPFKRGRNKSSNHKSTTVMDGSTTNNLFLSPEASTAKTTKGKVVLPKSTTAVPTSVVEEGGGSATPNPNTPTNSGGPKRRESLMGFLKIGKSRSHDPNRADDDQSFMSRQSQTLQQLILGGGSDHQTATTQPAATDDKSVSVGSVSSAAKGVGRTFSGGLKRAGVGRTRSGGLTPSTGRMLIKKPSTQDFNDPRLEALNRSRAELSCSLHESDKFGVSDENDAFDDLPGTFDDGQDDDDDAATTVSKRRERPKLVSTVASPGNNAGNARLKMYSAGGGVQNKASRVEGHRSPHRTRRGNDSNSSLGAMIEQSGTAAEGHDHDDDKGTSPNSRRPRSTSRARDSICDANERLGTNVKASPGRIRGRRDRSTSRQRAQSEDLMGIPDLNFSFASNKPSSTRTENTTATSSRHVTSRRDRDRDRDRDTHGKDHLASSFTSKTSTKTENTNGANTGSSTAGRDRDKSHDEKDHDRDKDRHRRTRSESRTRSDRDSHDASGASRSGGHSSSRVRSTRDDDPSRPEKSGGRSSSRVRSSRDDDPSRQEGSGGRSSSRVRSSRDDDPTRSEKSGGRSSSRVRSSRDDNPSRPESSGGRSSSRVRSSREDDPSRPESSGGRSSSRVRISREEDPSRTEASSSSLSAGRRRSDGGRASRTRSSSAEKETSPPEGGEDQDNKGETEEPSAPADLRAGARAASRSGRNRARSTSRNAERTRSTSRKGESRTRGSSTTRRPADEKREKLRAQSRDRLKSSLASEALQASLNTSKLNMKDNASSSSKKKQAPKLGDTLEADQDKHLSRSGSNRSLSTAPSDQVALLFSGSLTSAKLTGGNAGETKSTRRSSYERSHSKSSLGHSCHSHDSSVDEEFLQQQAETKERVQKKAFKKGGEAYQRAMKRNKAVVETRKQQRESVKSSLFASLDREDDELVKTSGPLMRRGTPARSKSTDLSDLAPRPLMGQNRTRGDLVPAKRNTIGVSGGGLGLGSKSYHGPNNNSGLLGNSSSQGLSIKGASSHVNLLGGSPDGAPSSHRGQAAAVGGGGGGSSGAWQKRKEKNLQEKKDFEASMSNFDLGDLDFGFDE
jgi:hypothetical protein